MNPKTKNQFSPDYSVPPGEILLEKIEEMGMSQKELNATQRQANQAKENHETKRTNRTGNPR